MFNICYRKEKVDIVRIIGKLTKVNKEMEDNNSNKTLSRQCYILADLCALCAASTFVMPFIVLIYMETVESFSGSFFQEKSMLTLASLKDWVVHLDLSLILWSVLSVTFINIIIYAYIDDLILVDASYADCLRSRDITILSFKSWVMWLIGKIFHSTCPIYWKLRTNH